MASDYDAPRRSEEEPAAPESLAALHVPRGGAAKAADPDIDESDTAEGIELPGADLSNEELIVEIVPPKPDEFTCSSCFLVRHHSQRAREQNGMKICKECES